MPDYRTPSGSLGAFGEATEHVHADIFSCLAVGAVLIREPVNRGDPNQFPSNMLYGIGAGAFVTRSESLFGNERLGEHHHSQILVQATPGSVLELVGTEQFIDLLVELLNGPAEMDQLKKSSNKASLRPPTDSGLHVVIVRAKLELDQEPDRLYIDRAVVNIQNHVNPFPVE